MERIEQATREDAEEILALQRLAYRSEAELYPGQPIAPLAQTLEQMRADLEGQLVLKAVLEGRIVGSVRGRIEGGTCHVGRLIVHPDLQNRGIGTRLLRELEKRAIGAARFELFTGHLSAKNIYLYKKVGYRLTRRERVSQGLELVYMEKTAE